MMGLLVGSNWRYRLTAISFELMNVVRCLDCEISITALACPELVEGRKTRVLLSLVRVAHYRRRERREDQNKSGLNISFAFTAPFRRRQGYGGQAASLFVLSLSKGERQPLQLLRKSCV